MMILNLLESLAKQLVMAKLNMAFLSSLKNRAKLSGGSIGGAMGAIAPPYGLKKIFFLDIYIVKN